MNLDIKTVVAFLAGATAAVGTAVVAYTADHDKVLVSKKKFCDSYDRSLAGAEYFDE